MEIGTSWLVLAVGAYYAYQAAGEMARYGIDKRREQWAGIWFGSELAWAVCGAYLLRFHHQPWGLAAAIVLGLGAVAIFVFGWHHPVEEERGQLALIDTRGTIQRWWWS